MDVTVCSPSATAEKAAAAGCALCATPRELFERSSHVVLQCALTPETAGLVGADLIDAMPREPCGRHLVNVARGGIAVEADVAAALASGALDSYATDVFDDEPNCRETSPLFASPNLFSTPHVGAATREAQDNVAVLIADRVMDVVGT